MFFIIRCNVSLLINYFHRTCSYNFLPIQCFIPRQYLKNERSIEGVKKLFFIYQGEEYNFRRSIHFLRMPTFYNLHFLGQ